MQRGKKEEKKMIELTGSQKKECEVNKLSENIVQLRNVQGNSVYITDPEGNMLEIKSTDCGSQIVFTKDEAGKALAIEERENGTRLYHISSDSTGLPSTHEVRPDQTEIIYFYDTQGKLQHFVELKTNGDRISTLLGVNGTIYCIEQRQIGGIIFQVWLNENNKTQEGMVWLHSDGDISKYGDIEAIEEIFKKFSRFLDGVRV